MYISIDLLQFVFAHVFHCRIKNEAVLHVNVGKIGPLRILSIIVGWIYFASWSATAYARIYDNYIRQRCVNSVTTK